LISGQQIIPLEGNHKGIIDPYVEMKVLGCDMDQTDANQFKSEVVEDNGFK